MYLFGASPALDAGFLRGRPSQLERLDEHTLYLPYATSLRMSDLGYQNNAQAGLTPCYNDLQSYIDSCARRSARPLPALREGRHPAGWRVGAAEHQHPADRKRVLLEHLPAKAASPTPASVRCRPWPLAACSTWKCAAWTSTRSCRWASTWTRRASSTPSCCLRVQRQPAAERRVQRRHRQLPRRGQGRQAAGPAIATPRPAGGIAGLGERAARTNRRHRGTARPRARRRSPRGGARQRSGRRWPMRN